MSNLIPFKFNTSEIRTLDNNGEILFIAKDVASCLGYEKPSNAITMHCKKAKSLKDLGYPVLGIPELIAVFGTTSIMVIPESDVYRLAMRSNLESSEFFQDWVVEEVLPSIRKTGSYSLEKPKSFSQALRLAADVQEKLEVAQLKIEVDAPKVQFAEVVSDSSNTRCIRIWVKAMKHENNLTVGEQQVFKWLLDNRYIFKEYGGYLPYSKYEANGTNYFTVVIDEINGKPRRALKITGKGVVALTGKVVSHFNPPRNGLVLLGEPA